MSEDNFFTDWGPQTSEHSLLERLELFDFSDDLFKDFVDQVDQVGEGVVTRRQAAAQALIESEKSKNVPQTPVQSSPAQVLEDNSPSSPLPGTSKETQLDHEAVVTDGENDNNDSDYLVPHDALSESHNNVLYPKDTLVAENDEVEAYAVKVGYRRMKNFT